MLLNLLSTAITTGLVGTGLVALHKAAKESPKIEKAHIRDVHGIGTSSSDCYTLVILYRDAGYVAETGARKSIAKGAVFYLPLQDEAETMTYYKITFPAETTTPETVVADIDVLVRQADRTLLPAVRKVLKEMFPPQI